MADMTYAEAIEKQEHLIALGQTTIYLRQDPFPWEKATLVETSGLCRFDGPVGCYVIAEVGPLTFKWVVDFEGRDANGQGVSLFERDRLREVMRKLPKMARRSFADMLRTSVLPDLKKRTAELRDALNKQADSEDCVAGLIRFAEDSDNG